MGWAFNIPRFAEMIAAKSKGSQQQQATVASKLRSKLWGENFVDRATGKWRTSSVSDDGSKLERGFCALILQPIYDAFSLAKAGLFEDALAVVSKAGGSVNLTRSDFESAPKVRSALFLS
jgi:elongation factor 2